MSEPWAQLLLAHGAGAGSHSDFMQSLARLFAAQGVTVSLLDFPYMKRAQREQKRRPPDRIERLQTDFIEQFKQLPDLGLPRFIGGKSMGGRVATLVANEVAVPVIVMGYPFHPVGKPERLRVAHFEQLTQPVCIVQGERDSFGKRSEIATYQWSSNCVEIHYLAAGDHSFKPLKSSGFTQQQHLQTAVNYAVEFMKKCVASS